MTGKYATRMIAGEKREDGRTISYKGDETRIISFTGSRFANATATIAVSSLVTGITSSGGSSSVPFSQQ